MPTIQEYLEGAIDGAKALETARKNMHRDKGVYDGAQSALITAREEWDKACETYRKARERFDVEMEALRKAIVNNA